ncbi:MAG: radical SAM protein [Theionarchaea archaeon]|nr:radical SAM protein [Theionarchaea archaeon]
MNIRLSVGSAVRLGLKKMKVDCLPDIIYMMTPGLCRARCLFCSQWVYEDRLSRVHWPEYDVEDVISRITKERICIQCLNYEGVFTDLLDIVDLFKGTPISVSAQPFSEKEILQLKKRIDRISVNLDCATRELFVKIKPFYTWENHVSHLLYSRSIFGPFRASSHVMVGLGETEEELVSLLEFLYSHQISSSLFAFTPVKGTPLEKREKPSITYYRRMQVAHYLIYAGKEDFTFRKGVITDLDTDVPPEAFMTRGCPGCNRPYYTATPRHLYNFPYIPDTHEIDVIKEQLKSDRPS